MAFSVVQAEPASEPVSLARAKAHLRADTAAEDDLITGWITAARELCEEYTQRAFVARSVTAIMDRFPPFDPPGWDFWLTPGYPSPAAVFPNPLTRAVRLPIWPVLSVDAVKYFDAGGVQQTLTDGTDYLTHLPHMPSLVYPAPGKIWPVTQQARMGCVEIDFTAGVTTVPQRFVVAVLLTLAYWYENRGDGKDPTGTDPLSLGLPAGAVRILNGMGRLVYV